MKFLNFHQNTDNQPVQNPTSTCENTVEPTAKVKKKPSTMTQKDGKVSPKRAKSEKTKYVSPVRSCKATISGKWNENGAIIRDKQKKSPKREGNGNIKLDLHDRKGQRIAGETMTDAQANHQTNRKVTKNMSRESNGHKTQSKITVNPTKNEVTIK